MSSWHQQPILAFDLETTGVNPDAARIVTATLVEVGPEGVARVCEWLVNPGIEIPDGAAEIHGVTTEKARTEGQLAESAIFEITGQIGLWLHRGRPVIGMNLAYDFTVLDRECRRQRIDTLSRRMGEVGPLVDVFVLDKHCHKYRKGSRTLTALAEHYGVQLDDAHTSAGDSLAAARIAWKMAEQYPNELQVPLSTLHSRQRAWRFEQSQSLERYFRTKGGQPDAVVDPHWPLHPVPADWTPDLVDVEDQAAAS
jgi:DNA polymerase-3 subunit epsilon